MAYAGTSQNLPAYDHILVMAQSDKPWFKI